MAPLLAAVIMSTTVSNSSTGGNVVSSGGTVENGSSYSSVSVENDVNGSGGTSDVQIQTDNNGQVNTQNITEPIIQGEPVNITVATSTGNASVFVHVSTNATGTAGYYARHARNPLATTTASSSISIGATTSAPFSALGLQGFDFVSFFHNLFSFFRW